MSLRAVLWASALVALAACERRLVPTPDPIVIPPPPAPSSSASAAPAPSAASMADPVPPGCSYVPLDGRAGFRDDLRWLALARDPEGGNDAPTFYVVELAGGALARALKPAFEGAPYEREWTPDGRTFVTSVNFHTGRGEVQLWDTTTWSARTTVSIYCGYGGPVSHDGTWLGTVGCTGEHAVIDLRRGAREERWSRGGLRMAADVEIAAEQSPDSKAWVVTDQDGQVELFGVHPLRLRRVVVKPNGVEDSLTQIAFRPDGRAFATAESDGALRIWDAASGALQKVLQKPLGKHGEHRTALAWGPEGLLATAELDGLVHLWDAATGAPAGTLGSPGAPADPNDHPFATPSFLGPGRVRLCAGPYDRPHLTVFERSSGRVIFEREGCGLPSPDGARLWFDVAGHLEIVDAATGAALRRVAWAPGSAGVEWTGGGRFVTWLEGTQSDQGFKGHLVRALRVADGARLWMALLDGPGGPRLVARGEGGAYAGDAAACSPGPASDEAPLLRPGLIGEFFAASAPP